MIEENDLFPEDERIVCDLLKSQWSLGPSGPVPVFAYLPESFLMNAGRTGSVYVYPVSATEEPSSTDYSTVKRVAYVAVRLSNRGRDQHFAEAREVRRILAANRRLGQSRDGKGNLGWYTYLEVTGIRRATDLSGWYATTFEIRLTTYNLPFRSAGLGPETDGVLSGVN